MLRNFQLPVQVADIIAKQRRIERQDKPTVDGVSFEHSAAGEMMYCPVLHCTVLYCTVLFHTVLYCYVLKVDLMLPCKPQSSACH
jgi:hypothetical protein